MIIVEEAQIKCCIKKLGNFITNFPYFYFQYIFYASSIYWSFKVLTDVPCVISESWLIKNLKMTWNLFLLPSYAPLMMKMHWLGVFVNWNHTYSQISDLNYPQFTLDLGFSIFIFSLKGLFSAVIKADFFSSIIVINNSYNSGSINLLIFV